MDHWDIDVFPLAHDVLKVGSFNKKNEKINLTKEGWNNPTPYPPKFKITLEKLPKPNGKGVFQPPFFRGEPLNSGGVNC